MKDKIRLCFLGDGVSIHTQRWARHFSGLGHDVHLISSRPADIAGVKVHTIEGTGYVDYIGKVFKARKLVKSIEPDMIHAHFVTDYGFMGAMTGFHPFVVSPWGSDIVWQPEESALFRFMVKFALKRADAIQCGDEDVAARVKTLVGDRGTVRLIGWGVDTDRFLPSAREMSDEVRILYLRISHDKYRTKVLLDAMPGVLTAHPEARFVILKKGEQLDRTLEFIKSNGLEDRVELIDPVPHEKMPELLNSCDIYLDTAYSREPGCGIGMTAMEAMSCGLPVVVTDTYGCDRLVEHGVTGYVYKGMDPMSLARALGELIPDAALRRRLGGKAREHVMAHQSWPANMKRMEQVYRELMDRGDAG